MALALDTLLVRHADRAARVRALTANQVIIAELLDLPYDVFASVATEVARQLNVPLSHLVWIEYAPGRSGPGAYSAERFTLVQFALDPERRTLSQPHWREVTRGQVEALLGQPLPLAAPVYARKPEQPPTLSEPTLPEAADRFLDEILGDRPRSRTTYRASLRVLQEWAVSAHLTIVRSPLPGQALKNDSLARLFGFS